MTAQGGQARAGGRRGVLPLLWPVALCLAIYASSGSLGFNPSDEGLVLAQARRVVQGGTPHIDIVSPRPLGSALLHAPEFAPARGPRGYLTSHCLPDVNPKTRFEFPIRYPRMTMLGL